MFDIESLFKGQHPSMYEKHPRLSRVMINVARWMWMEKTFQDFANANQDAKDIVFIERCFQEINFDLSLVSGTAHIPQTGKAIIIANHPLGYLDGIGLLKALSAIRPDVKMLVNSGLHNMLNMKEHTISVDSFRGKLTKNSYAIIKKHLANEGLLVIFPSGLVSRKVNGNVVDLAWNSSFLRFAEDFSAPIIPVFIDGKNSAAFYRLTKFTDPLAKSILMIRELVMMKLMREIFNFQRNQRVSAHVGEPAYLSDLALAGLSSEERLQVLRQRLYALKKSQ